MKIEDFLKKTNLPIYYYDTKFDIADKFEEEADRFCMGLSKIDGTEFECNKQKIIQAKIKDILDLTEKNKGRILKVFDCYEHANPKGAQEAFDELMAEIKPFLFLSTVDDFISIVVNDKKVWTRIRNSGENPLYRIRGVSARDSEIDGNENELFHVPIKKKHLMCNDRFSMAGFPCLYLATLLPLAWQECGYPSKYYFAEYRYLKMTDYKSRNYEDEIKLLSIYSPKEIWSWGVACKYNDFDLWFHVVSQFLIMYPLVMACAFVNHNGNAVYKQEYIIPQMLMQWIQRNSDTVQGVSYFSCIDLTMMKYKYCAYNIAIPAAEPFNEDGYSQKLKDMFVWTAPRYYEISLFNKEENTEDKKELYDFIRKLGSFKNEYIPDTFRLYINDMESVCTCIYQLMTKGENTDIQIVIQMMNLVIDLCRKIRDISVETMIENERKKMIDGKEKMVAFDSDELKMLSEEFAGENGCDGKIIRIIYKYNESLWNGNI